MDYSRMLCSRLGLSWRRTLPNIPPQYANALFNMEPRFVQYIMQNHHNLHSLVDNMDAQTLQYVAAHVPQFGTILSKLHPSTLEVVLGKLPNTDKHLADTNTEVVRATVSELASLAKYAHLLPTVTTPSKVPSHWPEMGEQCEEEEEVPMATVMATATEVPILTDEELGMVRSELQLVDELLQLVVPRKLTALRVLMPKLPQILNELGVTGLENTNPPSSQFKGQLQASKDVQIGQGVGYVLQPKPTCTGSRLSKLTDNLHTLKDVSIDQPMDMLLSTQPDCTASPLSTWKGNLARVQDVLIEGLLEKLELGGAMPSIFG
uniref:Tobamovirus multiplication protein 2B n=1 Tax=Echinococcus granulosus TaxID=6210 RepID=A0A068X569_ECHGR|nr:hypothetical protein EgrG_000082200 [Echinococcus granulosus]